MRKTAAKELMKERIHISVHTTVSSEADSFSEQVGVESTSSWMEKKRNAWGWKKTEYELSPCGRSRVNTLWLPGGRESEKWHLCALLSLGEKKKKKTTGDTAALFLEFGSTDTRHARDSFADEGSNFEGPLDAVGLPVNSPPDRYLNYQGER